jgi:hypothetical protein
MRYAWLLWHGKVALSADMMRRLHAELGVPLDLERLAEEVEHLRKTERRAVRSQLRLILSHSLRRCYQPDKRTDSRRSTIANGRVVADRAGHPTGPGLGAARSGGSRALHHA